MRLSFAHIETISKALDNQIDGLRKLLAIGKNDTVALAAFTGSDKGQDYEDLSEEDHTQIVTEMLNDLIAARASFRDITGL